MKYEVTIGVDLSAYATEIAEFDHEPTETEIEEWARRQYDAVDLVFEPEWESASSARVVEVFGCEGVRASDLNLEPQYHDVGQTAELMFRGRLSPGQALEYMCQGLGLPTEYAATFIREVKEL